MVKRGIFFLLVVLSFELSAKDFGLQGHTFEIVEEDLLEVIQGKLTALQEEGHLLAHQQAIQQKTVEKMRRPLPVSGLIKTQKHRIFEVDPSIQVPFDLQDHQGQVFVKAGTRLNPLDYFSLKKPLVFIDGDDEAQVQWALQVPSKIILVKGAPIDLSEHYATPFYFDQGGILIQKFGIRQVPAHLFQEGQRLKVEEVLLEEPS